MGEKVARVCVPCGGTVEKDPLLADGAVLEAEGHGLRDCRVTAGPPCAPVGPTRRNSTHPVAVWDFKGPVQVRAAANGAVDSADVAGKIRPVDQALQVARVVRGRGHEEHGPHAWGKDEEEEGRIRGPALARPGRVR